MRVPEATREAIEVHQAAGGASRPAACRASSASSGRRALPAVVLVHGVPTSSFLYRKVIPALAEQGLRAVAFDFPGLGLADRPEDFDYSWSGLSRWIGRGDRRAGDRPLPSGRPRHRRADRRASGRCANPERVLSLTALNTMLGVAGFKRPWSMQPFAIRGVGRAVAWRASPAADVRSSSTCRESPTAPRCLAAEVYAYYYLLKRADGGRAFLRIMRGFELTEEKQRFLWEGLAKRPYPARIVWGERDPALGLDQLRLVQEALEVRRPDPAAGQALPAGGPGDPGRQRDRRPGRAAGLRRRIALRPTPGRGRRSRAASAPRVRGTGSRRRRSRAAPRHPGTPRAPRRALRARRSARRCAPG